MKHLFKTYLLFFVAFFYSDFLAASFFFPSLVSSPEPFSFKWLTKKSDSEYTKLLKSLLSKNKKSLAVFSSIEKKQNSKRKLSREKQRLELSEKKNPKDIKRLAAIGKELLKLERLIKELQLKKESLDKEIATLDSIADIHRPLQEDLKKLGKGHHLVYDKLKGRYISEDYLSQKTRDFIKFLTRLRSPSAFLKFTNIKKNLDLANLDRLSVFCDLNMEQVLSYEAVSSYDADIDILSLSYVHSRHQVRSVELLVEANKMEDRHLRQVEKINSQESERLFKFAIDNNISLPDHMLDYFSSYGFMRREQVSQMLNIFQKVYELEHRLEPEIWDFVKSLVSDYSIRAFSYLLDKGLFKQDLLKGNCSRENLCLFARIPAKILTSYHLSAYKYTVDVMLVDEDEHSWERKYLERSRYHPRFITHLRRPLDFKAMKFFIEQQSSVLRKKSEKGIFHIPKKLSLQSLRKVNEHQLEALIFAAKSGSSKTNLINYQYIKNRAQLTLHIAASEGGVNLSPKIITLFASHFESNVASLFIREKNHILDEESIKLLKTVTRTKQSLVLSTIERALKGNITDYSQFIKLAVRVNNTTQVEVVLLMLSELVFDLLEDYLDGFSIRLQLNVLKDAINTRDEDLILKVLKNIEFVKTKAMAKLAKALILSGKDFSSLAQVYVSRESLLEKVKVLDIQKAFEKVVIDDLGSEYRESMHDVVVDNKKIDHELSENPSLHQAFMSYDDPEKLAKVLVGQKKHLCKGKDCPNFVTLSDSGYFKCPVCTMSKCYYCMSRSHKGTCADFEKRGGILESSDFTGLANFSSGLSNMCYYNSILKMLAKLIADVPSFRSFFDPQQRIVVQSMSETHDEYLRRVRVQEILWEIIQAIHAGVDIDDDGLAQKTLEFIEVFLAVLNDHEIVLDTVVGRDQHDAQRILNLLFSMLDFDKSALALHIKSVVTPNKMDPRILSQEVVDVLPVEVTSSKSAQAALDQAWESESLSGENQYYLDDEDKKVDALKIIHPVNAPDVLFLQLKRFGYNYKGGLMRPHRITRKVTVSKYLKLLRYDPDDPLVLLEELTYERVSAVLHHGQTTIESGHYTSMTWEMKENQKEVLVCHNDRSVACRPSDSRSLADLHKKAYLLAYKLVSRKPIQDESAAKRGCRPSFRFSF